ncbi:MAG: permease prefix domain 1-containing protein, partial [Terriglobales bacterium]
MRWRRFLARSRELTGGGRREADLEAELASHLELHTADGMSSGLTPEQARGQAMVKLGGLDQVRERCRDSRGWPGLASWAQDARYGLRRLRRAPGFTLAVVAILALGIGATSAVFCLFESLLLRWHAPEFPRFSVGISMPAACGAQRHAARAGADCGRVGAGGAGLMGGVGRAVALVVPGGA